MSSRRGAKRLGALFLRTVLLALVPMRAQNGVRALHEPQKNIELRTSNTQRPMRRTIRCSVFDVGCSMFLMDAEARFMVPMYAKKRKRASDEPRSARFLGVEIPGRAAAPAAVRRALAHMCLGSRRPSWLP